MLLPEQESMTQRPTGIARHTALSMSTRPSTCGRPDNFLRVMVKRSRTPQSPDRLRTLVNELCHHVPEWADRLSGVTSKQQLLDELCNIHHLLRLPRELKPFTDLSTEIKHFVRMNLQQGLTLKLLGEFLGYSEKYCSDLFRTTMGESFSEYVKRCRMETAIMLLTTTDRCMAEVAALTGFSDQFSFSHFFKRATGQSPTQFRARHRRASAQSSPQEHA